MKAKPGKLYVAFAYWKVSPEDTVIHQTATKPFPNDYADDMERTVTDLGEVARFALLMANDMEPLPNIQKIDVFELGQPILIKEYNV